MSNALAIAAVTAVLKDRLNDGLLNANLGSLGGFTVSSLPPDRIGADETPANRLNLFPYRVSPNTGWSNERLPSHSTAGARVTNPYLAIDVHYLLSAYGTEDLNDQILLGYGMQVLHETPVLGRDAVRASLGGGAVDGGLLPAPFLELAAADLADQVEQVRISPYYPELEATSQLWSSLNTGLRPTALYQATVLLIELRRPTSAALPVGEARLFVPTLRRPTITRLLSQADAGSPAIQGAKIVHGRRLVLTGSGLKGEQTRVEVDGVTVDENDLELSDRRIAFALPSELRAGVRGARVVHGLDTPDGGSLPGESSNVTAFVLSPSFVPGPDPAPFTLEGTALTDPAEPAGPVDGTVRVRLAHEAGADQRAELVLNELGGAATYGFAADRLPAAAPELTFPIRGVAQGTYIARVRIDGAESPLTTTDGSWSGPVLEVTL